jgi:hypothetical protein
VDRDKIARDIADMHDRLMKAGLNDVQACQIAGAAMAALMSDAPR